MLYPKVLRENPQLIHRLRAEIFRLREDFSTNPRPLLVRLFFYLLLIIFPANLAKRFILPESYVRGVLVDYLIPALYLIEGLVLVILLLSAWKRPKEGTFPLLLIIFLLSLIPWVLPGSFGLLSWFRFGEVALWAGFAYWVSQHLRFARMGRELQLLAWGAGWVTVLALGQLLLQHSVFGYWFLGEPFLTPSLGGVAEGSWLGREFLRPYGTFPHPNVLGGVLSVLAVWFLARKKLFSFLAGLLGTVISFSQTAWASLGLGIMALLVPAGGLGIWISDPAALLSHPSVQRRLDLLASAGEMIKSAPFWGVGLGEFTRALPDFGIPDGLTLFLQPVHNVSFLIAAESGIPAFLALAALFLAAAGRAARRRNYLILIALLQLFILGSFDHYLYTLPQGLFLSSLVIGLAFSD
ncbi:MAG: hypothetical protein Q8P12_00910 [bacterium]|nr:hypothetical protein [bacterium]